MISVDIEVSSGGFQTIRSFAKIDYSHQLNGNGFFEVVVAGSDEDFFSDYTTGLEIRFYNDGVLDLRGVVEKVSYTSEGLMRLEGVELGANIYSSVCCDVSKFVSSNSSAVISKLQSLTNGKVALSNVDSSGLDSFRIHSSQTCLQALGKLAELQGKYWFFDYVGGSVRVNLVNSKGSSKVALLNGGVDTGVVTKEVDDSGKVKKVTVIGASYGINQIIKSVSDGYSLGDAEVTIVDKSIMSNNEALARASLELAVRKKSKFNFRFDVIDFNRVFVVGDTIELFDKRTNTDAELRIVCVRRVAGGSEEFLELEVRSVDDRERAEDRLRQERELRSFSENAVSMNQKVDDTVLSGSVDVSISGSAVKNYASLSKSGSVGTGYNVTDQGYQMYGLSATCIKELSHGLTPVYLDNKRYWYHAAFCNFRINIKNTGSVGFATQYIYIWLQNDVTGEKWPDSTGILISDGFGLHSCDSHYHYVQTTSYTLSSTFAGKHNHGGYLGIGEDGEHNHNVDTPSENIKSGNPFNCTEYFTLWVNGYIQAPKSWQNQSYRLWYKITKEYVGADWYWEDGMYAPKVWYGYHGVVEPGHSHSDSISFSDGGHTHSVSGSGSGTASIPAHTHGTL